VRLKRSTSTLAIVILSSVTTVIDRVRLIAPGSCSRGLCFQEGPDVAYEHLVVLEEGAVP
jgi:hypothetical protein